MIEFEKRSVSIVKNNTYIRLFFIFLRKKNYCFDRKDLKFSNFYL